MEQALSDSSAASWKLSIFAPKSEVQAALLAHDEMEEWDYELAISGREISEDKPLEWVLEGWYPRKPSAAEKNALTGLFKGKTPKIEIEKLPAQDWLSVSQQGVEPIAAGPFYVHTPEYPPQAGAINFAIPAAQAFGTGQHETTAGCLEMLGAMKTRGIVSRAVADIGTGTGLLGFAAKALWPRAQVTLSDIDPICAGVVADNAALNGVAIGSGVGAMALVIAPGMDHELLRLRAPYDLLIANILAGPLVELARDFAEATAPSGNLVLAGLLAGEQETAVRRAYRRAGFRPVARLERGDWAILWMRRRNV